MTRSDEIRVGRAQIKRVVLLALLADCEWSSEEVNVVFRIPVIIIIIHIRKLRCFLLIPRQGPCHREVGCETLERL